MPASAQSYGASTWSLVSGDNSKGMGARGSSGLYPLPVYHPRCQALKPVLMAWYSLSDSEPGWNVGELETQFIPGLFPHEETSAGDALRVVESMDLEVIPVSLKHFLLHQLSTGDPTSKYCFSLVKYVTDLINDFTFHSN